ncbi:MAG: hypothetical protein A2913_01115 [Parcubacteria group bacterium RIFCSPLOWO2_01_FULL_40_65]|nr:MAG: hypothetical protein A2734_00755 [Parcubacteria group bacterium RIFCSPHIGHO2_01_FULL_40_30]OHB19484.1 MAG: hypothetical protein A3D40_02480 [Parcubacteria group bacterium RIFCSPHIGHO2_02_FULL_40_12]OHB22087.1 MAG: hypothetical protein A2913_01115 [Parcubacteria group bacterium RIFCSPLOWO2_01_FULL_40_65]OHB23681.1 MAG: hypothetical protein A3I22_02510 [Parcubacteria group bacterium RIFCSPLOWO2_02_FULL_40_12]OHB24378.1 MAG: hypothetical protein A3F96_00700 [Parcubacteria group bacterium R
MKITVKVKPLAREANVKKIGESSYEVAMKEPLAGGRANAAVREAIANHFGISYIKVRIISGWTSRQKILEIL